MSFQDVKAIYDSLPEDQKKFVDGESGPVAISDLNPDALLAAARLPGGYANLWRQDDGTSQVEIAVSPDKQGKGVGMELLYNLLRKADAAGIKDIHYIPHKSNAASNALIRKLVQASPVRVGDYMDYTVDPKAIKDPFETKLPPSVVKAVEDMKGVYKDMGYDLSDVGVKGTTRSRFESGAVTPYGIMPKERQVGASWVKNLNSIYFNPDVKAAMKLYGLKGSPDDFTRSLIAHELAHAVDQRYADDAMRKKVLKDAKDSGFTTPYLDNLPFKENRDKEVFAEWLAHKVMEKKSNASADLYKATHREPGPALLGEYGRNIGKAVGMPRREWEGDADYAVRKWRGIIGALRGKRVDVSAPRVTIGSWT